MPNPYDDILDNNEQEKPIESTPIASSSVPVNLEDPLFMNDGPEPLDEILNQINVFNDNAGSFSHLLSKLRVVDHQVRGILSKLFLAAEDPHIQGSLIKEKDYHQLQMSKFEAIIVPMRALAELHLEVVKQFNRDIDKNYYSVEKTDQIVKKDIKRAIDGLNLQRKILADASSNLKILTDGLEDTESRIKGYVNIGGKNNVSNAEYELLIRKRNHRSSGQEHNFDYDFFNINLMDKTAISLGIYMEETSKQYLSKLRKSLD